MTLRSRIGRSTFLHVLLNIVGYTVFGMLMFATSLNKVHVNLAMWLPMTTLGFYVEWRFIWKDREIHLAESAAAWMIKALTFGAVSNWLFITATTHYDQPWWLAKPAIAVILAVPSFTVSWLFVFNRWLVAAWRLSCLAKRWIVRTDTT